MLTYADVHTQVDALTGELAILRADVCMDLGTPLNPLIDLGQVLTYADVC
jgi:xanthine dehydrogenase molybdopterin-binding subunit B